MLTEGAATYRS